MANEEQLEILWKGERPWNEWRSRNPNAKPDLKGACLPDANLEGADLRHADLAGAMLRDARLSGAKLFDADISGANLRKACLDGAFLSSANLSQATLFRASLHRASLLDASLVDADLREANLTKADLTGADLRSVDLTGADLRWAILEGTNLGGATVKVANFTHANLAGANFRGANLSIARFDRADLSGADLFGADLSGAHVNHADFKGAGMERTVVGNVDLSLARGLDSVVHVGPSTIGIDTIYRSKGNIPESFLRGAGVPEPFIANMKALVAAMDPIQFYSCFISYSSKDEEFAERLYADLQQKHVRCWFDREDMKIGDRIRPRIDDAIRVHDKLLLMLTESSVKSTWVEKEAFEKERKQGRTVLFPIRLDDAVMEAEEAWAADIRRTRHIGDFCGWKEHDKYKKAFERLMRDLKAEA